MKLKRILACVLSSAMILTSVPAMGLSVSAESADGLQAGNGVELVNEGVQALSYADESTEITINTDNVRANSEQNPAAGGNNADGPASYAFNRESSNWWHSRWSGSAADGEVSSGAVSETNPIWIEAGLGGRKNVTLVTYLPRTDNATGRINKYEILAADMGDSTELPADDDFAVVKSGNLSNEAGTKTIDLGVAVQATHIRLKVYSVHPSTSTNHVAAEKIQIYEYQDADTVVEVKDISAAVKAGCEAMGTAEASASKIAEGTVGVTLTATPAGAQYDFVCWTNKEGNVVSTDAVYPATAPGVYTAEFAENTVAKIDIKDGTIYANSEYSSERNGDGPATYAFDGNEDNWWHSNYDPNNDTGQVSDSNPIYIQAGFEGAKKVARISYTPRKTSSAGTLGQNVIKDFEILAANSTEAKPADSEFVSIMTGTLEQSQDEQIIVLPYAVEATHIRIQATSVWNSSYVTARNIAMYADTSGAEAKQIVSFAGKVFSDNATMGTVSMTPTAGIENKDTQVTLMAFANPGYHFENWTVTGAAAAPEGAIAQVTLNSSNNVSFTAVFAEGDDPYYKESAYWEKESAAGTLSEQTADDIWHYQIKVSNVWSDIDGAYYYPDTGQWLQQGTSATTNFHYAKIAKDELTTTFSNETQQAVGFAWKAINAGYYSAVLEEDTTGGNDVNLHVSHASKDALTGDGEELLAQSISSGQNFESRIAKAEEGDYIRIYGTKANTWVTGFKPMIVEKTVKDYAAQCLKDVDTLLNAGNTYAEKRVEAVTAAKTEVETVLAKTDATDAEIEEKVTALEAAAAKLDDPVITGTDLTLGGKLGVNFYTSEAEEGTKIAEVEFTTDTGKSATVIESTTASGCRVFTYEIAAKEMADVITATLKDSDGNVIDTARQSVKDYANTIINGEFSEKTKDLAKAMLHYGAAAQAQFGYNTEKPANAGLAAIETNTSGLTNQTMTYADFIGSSLVLKSETTLRLYFADSVAADTITVKNGEAGVAVKTGTKGAYRYVEIPNIAANHLGDVYEVFVNGTSAGKCGALAYCYKVVNGSSDKTLKNLAAALYQYHLAASAYEDAAATN